MYGTMQRHYREVADRRPVGTLTREGDYSAKFAEAALGSDVCNRDGDHLKPEYAARASATSGICGHSTIVPYESYAIFCVGQSLVRQAAFRAWATDHKIGFKSLQGMYKGQAENSFIVNVDDLTECAPWYSREETVLILGPATRNGVHYGNRLAYLRYQDKHEEYIGLWQWTTAEYARKLDNWTYDPAEKHHYYCEKPISAS